MVKPWSIPSPKKRHWLLSETAQALIPLIGSLVGATYLVYQKLQAGPDLKPLEDLIAEAATGGKHTDNASAALTAARHLTDGLTLALIALGWVVLTSIYKLAVATHKDRQTVWITDPNHLLGPLLMLQKDVTRRKGLDDTDDQIKRFRATLHTVEKDEHIQSVRYVGYTGDDPARRPGPNRRWPNRCGIVGRIIREKRTKPLKVAMGEHVKTTKDYWNELITLYAYTYDEAIKSEPDRMAVLAVPITDGSRIQGVVYCDSSERDFFDDEEIVVMAVQAATAIAEQLQETQ